MKKRFDIYWVGHCDHDNKVWGCFRDPDPDSKIRTSYCFWAVIGKTISFTKFAHWDTSNIDRIKNRKIKNKYTQIDLVTLLAMWPNFMQDIENKFIWDKLAEKI